MRDINIIGSLLRRKINGGSIARIKASRGSIKAQIIIKVTRNGICLLKI